MKAVLHICRRATGSIFRPYFYLAKLPAFFIIADHYTTQGTGTGSTGPDYVRVGRVCRSEAALATANIMPHAGRDKAPPKALGKAAAGSLHGGAVLPVGQHIVGNGTVGSHVVELRDGQLYPVPGLAPVGTDGHPAVTYHDMPVRMGRVYPHFMVVPVGGIGPGGICGSDAAIYAFDVAGGEKIHFMRIVGRYPEACVVSAPS